MAAPQYLCPRTRLPRGLRVSAKSAAKELPVTACASEQKPCTKFSGEKKMVSIINISKLINPVGGS